MDTTQTTLRHATKATRTGATKYGTHYAVTMSDGATLSVSVPAAECRNCGGTGQHWNGLAFTAATCPTCDGDGLAK